MNNNENLGVWAWIAFTLAGVAGWLTHIVICFTEREWGFLIAGAIFFPVAVIHGWGRWFGFW
jgi:hypothetical protein